MKSYIISIQPQWVRKILNGEKTIEVRKRYIEPPFKVYIYCTKDKRKNYFNLVNHYGQIMFAPKSWDNILNGKVVAEFVVNEVEQFNLRLNRVTPQIHRIGINACLSYDELNAYLKGKNGFAFHITDLKVYDEPKELDNFTGVCKTSKRCGESKICSSSQKCLYDKLTKPPATWMYVKER